MQSKVAIVILNYMTYIDTIVLVKSIRSLLVYDNYKIIVVDNASPNESGTELKNASNELGFIFLQNDRNTGYAAGNNVAIRFAVADGSKYILILNNDIVLNDVNFLTAMVDLFESNYSIAVVSPKILKPSKGEELQFFERPSVYDMSIGYMTYHMRRKKFDTCCVCKIYRPQGCCMMLRGTSVQKIDYMDEGTFLYCEEDILAECLLAQDYECWLCGTTSVIHNHSVTVSTTMSRINKASITFKSFMLYLKKYRKIKNPVTRYFLGYFKFFVVAIRR